MYHQIHCSKLSPILELSVKFASQICHENINKPLGGAYLADFDIDINSVEKIDLWSNYLFQVIKYNIVYGARPSVPYVS